MGHVNTDNWKVIFYSFRRLIWEVCLRKAKIILLKAFKVHSSFSNEFCKYSALSQTNFTTIVK